MPHSAWGEIEELSVSAEGIAAADGHRRGPSEDAGDVYVAVGKKGSSADALSWALKNAAAPGSFVYLIHVFPEISHIPTPLGMLPKHQVSPRQLEVYMSRERAKRKAMLQKFLNMCHSSKVLVDTLLIESDSTAKAIADLIPVLNIRRLVIGTSRPAKKRRLGRGSCKAEQVCRGAPHYCDVTVICEGKKISFMGHETPAASPTSGATTSASPSAPPENNKKAEKAASSIFCFCKTVS